MRGLKVMLLAGALAGLSMGGALAAGSGGGGSSMSAMPSDTAPRYDPAQEYAKAIAAIQAKDYKTAARSAQRVADAAPKNLDAWKLLGVAHAGAENWKGAKKAYEKAVKLSPDDVAAHAGLGVALARLQDQGAQAELDWLKGKQAGCTSGCDTLKSLTAEVEKAVGAGAAATGAQPSAALERGTLLFAEAGDRAYVEAVGLINERRYDDALASLDAARKAFGPHPDILTYQGYAWRKKGDYARAETYYRQALAVAPAHRGATEYYGELKVERGDLAGAKVMLAKLDAACAYGCAEAEELRRWIAAGREPGL